MSGQLLLRGPYGWDQGHAVSLSLRRSLNEPPLEYKPFRDALSGYGVWLPVVPKIVHLLQISGRYDCMVDLNQATHAERMARDLKPFGVTCFWGRKAKPLLFHYTSSARFSNAPCYLRSDG